MRYQYSFELSQHISFGETTFHLGCGHRIVEARLLAEDVDQSFDSSRCWLICTGSAPFTASADEGIPDDFDPIKQTDLFCLCINEAVLERLSYWDHQGKSHTIKDELFVSVPDGANLPDYEPIFKIIEDPKTGVTTTRPAFWSEERAYYKKHTSALISKWSEKVSMKDSE